MGARAVIVICDETGRQRRLWSAWASPQFQIAHLAEFIHTADQDALPLSVAGYLTYVDTHSGGLPARDITDTGAYSDPVEVGDLNHRYMLLLHQTQRSFRYLMYELDDQCRPAWRQHADIGTRGHLYQAAARCLRQVAATTQRFLDRHGVLPRRWAPPSTWQQRAAQVQRWMAETDPQLLHRAGPMIGPVPQWYAVHRGRALLRRINTTLRQAYPGARIRTRIGTDGVVTLTVPAALATDTAQATRITQLIAKVCGQPFAITVRPHRPVRHLNQGTDPGTRGAVYATLTLRPSPSTGGGAAGPSPHHQPTIPRRDQP
jgi:hypothetical protein